ncbi:molybdenum ABC transporter ATP-binding protein [Tibeticola sp.]|jgi:molybdate transport system ATP-binding protein|uniref:molybdenum ABC transporter ATP-binding protein n=1 Tax=Tibeticola sp. TaxID=2005368 RepID=UPI0025873381|nr:molybdenum ABC transporter ATP-binding protein [Tibeticola sp.]MCI4439759.1 molybdenum ABC transporter ATP-binding protein [Tibeticola sp.]
MIQGHLQLQRGAFLLDTGAFAFEADGVTAIFGRSGCGKSSLLRAIAGLDADTRGRLTVRGEVWQDGRWARPVAERDIGFVFQDAALFPHLSVRGNLRYALRRAPHAPSDALEAVAERVGIAAWLDQAVTTLSGGQRQRVAIARALLMQPRLLCMDEPLAALDWRAKAELLPLIDELARETGVAVLFVTHAPVEVERLATRVLFMADGRIERIEPLQAALARPDSPLFAEEGPVTVLQGGLQPSGIDGLLRFDAEGVPFLLVASAVAAAPRASRLRVLARDVALAVEPPRGLSMLNQLPVTVQALHPAEAGRVTVACGLANGHTLLAQLTAHSVAMLGLQTGQAAWALVKSVALVD